jgi:hypothetical protein
VIGLENHGLSVVALMMLLLQVRHMYLGIDVPIDMSITVGGFGDTAMFLVRVGVNVTMTSTIQPQAFT